MPDGTSVGPHLPKICLQRERVACARVSSKGLSQFGCWAGAGLENWKEISLSLIDFLLDEGPIPPLALQTPGLYILNEEGHDVDDLLGDCESMGSAGCLVSSGIMRNILKESGSAHSITLRCITRPYKVGLVNSIFFQSGRLKACESMKKQKCCSLAGLHRRRRASCFLELH